MRNNIERQAIKQLLDISELRDDHT